MKDLRKAAAFLCALLILFLLVPSARAAEEPVVKLEMGSDVTELQVGEQVNVWLRFSGEAKVAGVYAHISYDPERLEYVSGDAEGDTGSLVITRMEEEFRNEVEYALTFTAKVSGETMIEVLESGIYDDQAQLIGEPTASLKLQIEEEGKLSGDATLKSLMTSYGKLEPTFNSAVTQYTIHVSNDIKVVTLTAVANDSMAAVEISGITELAEGSNQRVITVTAEDGTTKVYQVDIIRAKGDSHSSSESSSPAEESGEESAVYEETVSFKLAGMTMYLQSPPDGTQAPRGFEWIDFPYHGKDYKAAQEADSKTIMLYLADFKGEKGQFYYYDPEKDICLQLLPLFVNGKLQLLVDAEQGGEEFKGYHAEASVVDGYRIRPYLPDEKPADQSEEYVFYNLSDMSYYVYSPANRTLKPFVTPAEQSAEESSEAEESRESSEESSEEESSSGIFPGRIGDLIRLFSGVIRYLPYILGGLAVLAIILLILIVMMALSLKKRRRQSIKAAGEYDHAERKVDQNTRTMVYSSKSTTRHGSGQKKSGRGHTGKQPVVEQPEDPNDIQLDTEAFDQWKAVTQKVPLAPMTEVHTTTFNAITMSVPDTGSKAKEKE